MTFETFDGILNRIGAGRYQIKTTFFAFILTACMALHVLSSIFIAYLPPHECDSKIDNAVKSKCNVSLINELPSGELSKCDTFYSENDIFNCTDLNNTLINTLTTGKCKAFTYDVTQVVNSSISIDFNLVCGRSAYNYLLQSMFMLGVLFNGLVFGKASDRIGRRPVIMIMGGSTVVVGVVISFIWNFELYVVFRTLLGFTCFVGPMTYVLVGESTPSKYRHYIVLISTTGYSTGTMLIGLLAYFFRYWRTLEIVISLIAVFILFIGWIVEESPRWLISRGRYKEAMKNIRIIAKFNNCDESCFADIDKFEENLYKHQTDLDQIEKETDESGAMISSRDKEASAGNAPNIGMIDTLKTKNLRMQTLVLTCAWFSTSCAFYGLTLNIANIGGDVYVNTMIMGIAGFPATALAIYVCKKIGRRSVVAYAFIFSGVFCLLMYFVPEDLVWLQITFFMIGRTGTIIPFETLFLYTIELYPTPMRSTAVGYGSAIARIGAIVSPVIAMMATIHSMLPYITFGILTITAGILVFLLPETRKSPLLETLGETETFIGEHPGPLRACTTSSEKKI